MALLPKEGRGGYARRNLWRASAQAGECGDWNDGGCVGSRETVGGRIR